MKPEQKGDSMQQMQGAISTVKGVYDSFSGSVTPAAEDDKEETAMQRRMKKISQPNAYGGGTT